MEVRQKAMLISICDDAIEGYTDMKMKYLQSRELLFFPSNLICFIEFDEEGINTNKLP